MKKLFLLIVLASTLLTSGCLIKEKDLGQMFFPISLGITYEDSKYKIYLQVLNTSTISIVETEGSISESTYILIHEEDEDINKIFTKLGLKTLTYISAIKLRSIIINKSVFDKGPVDYHELCQYFVNSPIFRTKVKVYITEKDIEEFYSIKYNLVGTGIYSHASDKSPQLIQGYTIPAYLIDSLKSYYENNRMYSFPIMDIKENLIEEGDKEGKLKNIKAYAYGGVCYTTYSKSRLECLTKEETAGYKWYNELSYLNNDLGNNSNPLNVIVDKSKWKTEIENNTFQITVSTQSYININSTNLSLNEIKKRLNEKIKKDIENTLKIAYEKDIDIYHLNDYAFRKGKNLKYNLENVKINVESKIKNTTYYKY
jgi:hypothetical protein